MNRIDTLRDQIDAVRPDSDDLSLPGLTALAQAADEDRAVADELDRSQQFDRTVAAALHDVPVPRDLLARLLKAAAAAPATVSAPERASPPPPRTRVSRRVVMALASLAAAALLAVGIGIYGPRAGRNVSQAELSDSALRWYADVPVTSGWTPASQKTPSPFGFPARAMISRPAAWQHFQSQYGSAVVYDCAAPGRPRALLFVVRTRDDFAVGTLPFSRLGATGGKAIGAWQSGELLYVLVIDRDRQQRLEDHVRSPREA